MSERSLRCLSAYAPMSDGIRLAVSAWLPADYAAHDTAVPVVLITTRYWRAMRFRQDAPQLQSYYPFAAYLIEHGYILAVADARGTGASFGTRFAETDCYEVDDIGQVTQWVAQQPWCDGRVVTTGCSYSASTALYSLVTAPPALKLSICRAPDFDMYRHLFAPGGIVNHWFIETWGEVTAAQDANDVQALFANGYWLAPANGAEDVLGVLPVDTDKDGSQLAAAVHDHKRNFNIKQDIESLACIDGFLREKNPPFFDPAYQRDIEASGIPLLINCGWHDAGTALGALCFYKSFNTSVEVVLGPWNHEGNYVVDPFQPGDGTTVMPSPKNEVKSVITGRLDKLFKEQQAPSRCVRYFTLGANSWQITDQWPLPNTKLQRWYLAEDHQLTLNVPTMDQGGDTYQVDPTATTGRSNRWYAQSPDQPVLFPDRQQEDNKLLVYDSAPLTEDTEITGHPVVHLYCRSTATDGQFFVYLETVDPDGRVRLLTEGQLRGIHRKVSTDTPPYTMFGPYHSLKEKDLAPLVPGEITDIAFDLLPISVLLKKGQRIRVAVAGADKDTFKAIPDCEAPQITVERNRLYASCIDLPIICRQPTTVAGL